MMISVDVRCYLVVRKKKIKFTITIIFLLILQKKYYEKSFTFFRGFIMFFN
jgi:hypothetical protein